MKKLLNYFGNLMEYRFPALMLVAAVGLALGLALLRFSEFLFDAVGAGQISWAVQKPAVLLCFIVLALPTLAMFRFFVANKNWVLAHRFRVLVFAGWMGMALAFDLVYYSELFVELIGVEKIAGAVEKFVASLWVIVLGLPTVGMLWFFRTNDTLEQIHIARESMDASILTNAQKMMSEDAEKPGTKTLVGFDQLMRMRQRGSYLSAVDAATRNANLAGLRLIGSPMTGMYMRGAYLPNANMRKSILVGADLRNAHLYSANLTEAELLHANLRRAHMEHAVLENANLQFAHLQGANLSWATTLSNAVLSGAEYSDETKFPNGFDPDKAGMIKKQ